ncbi:Conserved hypothetical protein [Prochlorococcus marinus str. MIT 9515]|uniref:Uncharacterized protein n=1 Tax=Prochlorococcus marinus (strain MIT 9515) TaxID=167542 RepID=A2BW16_PROM5|nr:hypothetical protein [Prochlorococcus marinus]ABM71977.1 Conserved hypothetical protein [Prochlorococcus marinus str. MIT 9515]
MKSLRISTYNINYLPKILDKLQKKKSSEIDFITWFLVWYLGSSILLLLSLHSYFMGFGK